MLGSLSIAASEPSDSRPTAGAHPRPLMVRPAAVGCSACWAALSQKMQPQTFALILAANDWATILPSRTTNVSEPTS